MSCEVQSRKAMAVEALRSGPPGEARSFETVSMGLGVAVGNWGQKTWDLFFLEGSLWRAHLPQASAKRETAHFFFGSTSDEKLGGNPPEASVGEPIESIEDDGVMQSNSLPKTDSKAIAVKASR